MILAAFCCALCLEVLLFPHYAAPATGILFVPVMYGVRLLRVKAENMGPALVFIFVAVGFSVSLGTGLSERRAPTPRQEIEERLVARGGQHLVIVRYSSGHDAHQEFVFNRADIDGAGIVWARDMGDAANRELIDYYRSRHVWLLAPDLDPISLVPYQQSVAGQ